MPSDPNAHGMRLADRLASAGYDDLPADRVEEARMLIADVVGASIMGARGEWDRVFERTALRSGHGDESTLLGGRESRAAAHAAAQLNAARSHQIELAPIVSRAVAHLDAVVPAALAVAERERASGRDLLRSVVLGSEALIRFGRALATDPDHVSGGDHPVSFLKGWWVPAFIAPFGAATASAVLQAATPGVLLESWGLASNLAPAATMNTVLEGATGRGYLMAGGVGAGLAAADLALGGAGGLRDLPGWMRVAVDVHDIRRLDDETDREWEFSGVVYKHFPTVGPLFPAIEAALTIADRWKPDPTAIDEILVHGFGRTLVFAPRDPPATVEAARSHLGFCLATALIRRDRLAFFTDAFDPSSLADPTILRLARRVQALLDPQYDAEYPAQSAKARVEIRLTSGEVLTAEADRAAIGRYHHPTRSDIAEKFAATTGQSLDPLSAENFLEDVWHLEQTDDIGPMMNRLSTALRRPQ